MSDPSPHAGPLAFGDFLEDLRRQQGFTIGVGDYLRLQQLLNQVSQDCAPSDLKTLLCPLLATNKIQQEQFHEAFDSYFALFKPTSVKPETGQRPQGGIPDITAPPKPIGAGKRVDVLLRPWLLLLMVVLTVFMTLSGDVLLHKVSLSAEVKILPNPNPDPAPPDPKPSFDPKPPPDPDGKTPPITPSPQPTASPQKSFYQRYGTAIYLGAILAPLIGFLIYERHRFNRRKLTLEKQRGKKPPFVWPLKVAAPGGRLYNPQQLYSTARLMRRRQVGEFYRLDMEATVAATIAARGYPSFCYKPDSKPPEYLVLIDQRSFRDHQAQLFDELAKALAREGVFIARYFYDGDPRVCRHENGGSFDLVELQNKYGEHRLLIFGNGDKLINPITGNLETWAGIFAAWSERALLIPKAPSQWSLEEIRLADLFILLPATLEGLWAGVDHFESPVVTELRIWQQSRSDARLPNLEQMGLVDRLRDYLGEEIFQWLCACAVYPEMHWDLTLYLGSLACMPEGLVKEANVLKLIRLPWFRSGSMPDELRWSLIRKLDREKEQAIRAAIIELMEKHPPPQETFAADAYQLNLVVQRWLFRRERKRRREMLKALKTLPQSPPFHDYTLMRFLDSARVSSLDFLLPRRLRKLFYQQGIPAFGLRTGARFLGALTVSAIMLLAYLGLYWPKTLSTPHTGGFSNEVLLQRNIAARSASSRSCFDCHSITGSVQNNCTTCHTTSGFQPTIYDAHTREGLGCTACHTEHQGADIQAGLVSYNACSNCHNESHLIKTGEGAGTALGIPHDGAIRYPDVNSKWEWKLLTAEQIRLKGWPDNWANASPLEQFHSVHDSLSGGLGCNICHTQGSAGTKAFRSSPQAECVKCHGALYKRADTQTEQVNCSYCHKAHGQTRDLTKPVLPIKPNLDNDPVIHYNQGNTLLTQKKYVEAEAEYKAAIKIDPNFATAHSGLGNSLYYQQKYTEAVAVYMLARELDPNNIDALKGLGDIFYEQGRYSEAEVAYRQAIVIKPNDAYAHSGLGYVLGEQGKYAAAADEYKRAISLDANYANDSVLLYNLGVALVIQQKYVEAEDKFRRAMAINPSYAKDAGVHYYLGFVLDNQRKDAAAADEYKEALRINPNYQKAQDQLDKVLKRIMGN
jgi:tetratricopeptide (TPR) repeat protein